MRIFIDLDDVLVDSSPLQQKELASKVKEFSDSNVKAVDDYYSMLVYYVNNMMNEEEIINYKNLSLTDKVLEVYKYINRVYNKALDLLKNNLYLNCLSDFNSNDVLKNNNDLDYEKRLNNAYDKLNIDIKKILTNMYYWFNNNKYTQELEKIYLSINPIEVVNLLKDRLFEERDTYLERNNLLPYDKSIINYRRIYSEKNLIVGSKELIKEIKKRRKELDIETYSVLSHHNGGYEEYSKKLLINECLCKIRFSGLFFHSIIENGKSIHLEHKDGNLRRIRSSKADYVKCMYNLDDLSECILIDDSLANLDEWYNKGGIPIYFNRFNKEYNRDYPCINELNLDLILLKITEYKKQKKVKIK